MPKASKTGDESRMQSAMEPVPLPPLPGLVAGDPDAALDQKTVFILKVGRGKKACSHHPETVKEHRGGGGGGTFGWRGNLG